MVDSIGSFGIADEMEGLPNFRITESDTTDRFGSFGIADEMEDVPSRPVVSQTEEAIPTEYNPVNWKDVKNLTPDQIINTPEYMDVVDRALEARYGDRNAVYGAATYALGGATASFRGKSKEERFEIFQNWQRSFAGGQTVTTTNEIGFASRADAGQWNDVSEGYMLFDKMGNIFTGDGTWGDTFDGVKDYVTSAIWDPVTVASLGIGKLLVGGTTKAAATALKELGKLALRKELNKKGSNKFKAKIAEKAAIQAAVKKIPKSKRMLTGAKNLAAYSAVDFVANIGTDVAYQTQMIDAKVQEKYSSAQTGFAALGTIMIPTLIQGSKGIGWLRDFASNKRVPTKTDANGNVIKTGIIARGKDTIYKHLENFIEVNNELANKTWDEVTGEIKKRTNNKSIFRELKGSFDDFRKNKDDFNFWFEEVAQAKKSLKGKRVDLNTNNTNFWNMFLFGGKNKKGFIHSLSDNGFVYINRSQAKGTRAASEQDTVSNFIGDAMTWTLTDGFVKKFVKDYEATFGSLGTAKPKNVKEFSALFKARGSEVGAELALRSKAQGILNKRKGQKGFTNSLQKSLEEQGTAAKVPDAQTLRYTQSVWKRLLTANPSTTGLNIKGWAFYNMANTTSDLVLGGLKLGQANFYKFTGNDEAYKAAMDSGKGSAIGAMRRGLNYLNGSATYESGLQVLELKPEVREKLFRVIAGDAGDLNAIKTFGMNEQSKLLQAVEKGVLTTQQVTGVILQDEITKVLSFQTAFDTAIMREYGQTFNEFMSRSDAYIEMFTPRFKENVDAKALHRAQIETASKPWSVKQGQSYSLQVAKFIEKVSAAPGTGFLVPFGQFFNTSTALLGDYTMINATKHLIGIIEIPKLKKGNTVNYAEDEGLELLAKGITGWGAMAVMFGPAAEKRLAMGFKWNQEEESDGSVADKTYDWPESYGRIIGQMRAHWKRDGEVPSSLRREAMDVIVGQTFRQLDDASKELLDAFIKAAGGDFGEAGINAFEAIMTASSRVLSGATRPLDPINQILLATLGKDGQIDRNQGNKFIAQSTRYIDGFFGGIDRPDKATTTRGTELQMNYGKTLAGARETSRPNDIERVLSSLGIPEWASIKWEGDAEVKNVMNSVLGQIFNQEAEFLLNEEPDFFDLPIILREDAYNKIKKRAKERAEYILENSFDSKSKVIVLKKELAGLKQKDIKRMQTYLGIEGDPMKLIEQEGGIEQLELLIYMTKNIKETIIGDFN